MGEPGWGDAVNAELYLHLALRAAQAPQHFLPVLGALPPRPPARAPPARRLGGWGAAWRAWTSPMMMIWTMAHAVGPMSGIWTRT